MIDQRSLVNASGRFLWEPARRGRDQHRNTQLFIAGDAYGAIIAHLPCYVSLANYLHFPSCLNHVLFLSPGKGFARAEVFQWLSLFFHANRLPAWYESLLAESRRAFLKVKAINLLAGLLQQWGLFFFPTDTFHRA
jgi:hypothetical protein